MRTVRSVARRRNQPRGHLALIVLAILALLAVLAVRANASPLADEDLDEVDDQDTALWHGHAPRAGDSIVGDARAVDIAGMPGVAPIGEVVAAAYRAGGVADDPVPSWRRRSRLSALVPLVAIRGGQNEYWREDALVTDPPIGHALSFDVRAMWRLERLVFDASEPRIAMLDIARRRERRRLAAVAIHLYFDWLADRSAQTAAELDALTAGWFSQQLAKSAEPRMTR